MNDEQKQEIERIMECLIYWRDISECYCDSEQPIGGCLFCDLKRAIKKLSKMQ